MPLIRFALYWINSFSRVQAKILSISLGVFIVEKIDEYDLACTLSMNWMLLLTASSCLVRIDALSDSIPSSDCKVSSSVKPPNTFPIMSCSLDDNVRHVSKSFDNGIRVSNQNCSVNFSQVNLSIISSISFQLIAI